MATQDELLHQLAERPFDPSLRQVFADWLLERGDPRGEVIASAASTSLSLSERRRLVRLAQEHALSWLGPLAQLVDPGTSRFEHSFLSHAVVVAPAHPSVWQTLAGDPRLATVTSLDLPPMATVDGVAGFLRHPVLRHVKRLQASGQGLAALAGEPPVPFVLDTVAVSSWGVFSHELDGLAEVITSGSPRLELVTSEFVNQPVAAEVLRAVAAQAPVRRFKELRLVARFGVFEGVAGWLNHAAAFPPDGEWPALDTWSAAYAESVLSLGRAGGRFSRLTVDLRNGDELVGLGQRIATAASLLVLLAPSRLEEVDVLLPSGARLRPFERDALRTAARRLGTVRTLRLGGEPVSP